MNFVSVYTVFWYSKGSNENNSSIDTFNFHNTSSLPGNENSILIFVTTWNSFDLQLHLTYLLTNTTDNSAVFRMFSGLKKKKPLKWLKISIMPWAHFYF